MDGAISFTKRRSPLTKRRAEKRRVLIISNFIFRLLCKYAVSQNSLNFFLNEIFGFLVFI